MDNNFSDSAKKILEICGGDADTAVILGSGLGGFASKLENAICIPYADIPGFPRSTAPGHEGKIYFGTIKGRKVYCLAGRFHCYEGYSANEVVFSVRALSSCGVKKLIVTNAAGGINTSFKPGELMLITDHINFLPNPLIGKNDDSLGPRFPDMTYAYSPALCKIAREEARKNSIELREGVYIAVSGPSYETPAEISAFRTLGADAVGMSTVPEVIAANHLGMNVLGISLITNMAAGVLEKRLTGEEVIEAGKNAAPYFERLVADIVGRIAI